MKSSLPKLPKLPSVKLPKAKGKAVTDTPIKLPSLNGLPGYGHLGHFAQDSFIQEGHNTVDDPEMTAMAVARMTGGAKLTPDEAVDLVYPQSPQEAAQEKVKNSYIKDGKKRTEDEKYMIRQMQRKSNNVG